MRGSTRKPVVRTKIHSLRLKTKKPKESDRDVQDKLEKEAGDAWDEYDEHMKEALADDKLSALSKASKKAQNTPLKNLGRKFRKLTGRTTSFDRAYMDEGKQMKKLSEGKDVTLSGRNSIDADTSKKQETWKMNKELKNAIAKAIKASRAQIISTYGKPIHPGKVNPRLNEERTKLAKTLKSLHEKHSRNQLRQALNYHDDAEEYSYDTGEDRKAKRHAQAYRTAQKMLDKDMWKKAKNWKDLSDDEVFGTKRRRHDARHALKMTIKKAKRKKAASR